MFYWTSYFLCRTGISEYSWFLSFQGMPVLYWFSGRMSVWGTISFNLAVFINLIIAFFYPFDSEQRTSSQFLLHIICLNSLKYCQFIRCTYLLSTLAGKFYQAQWCLEICELFKIFYISAQIYPTTSLYLLTIPASRLDRNIILAQLLLREMIRYYVGE